MPIVLISQDSNNHAADEWSLATAQLIFDPDPSLTSGRLLMARNAQTQIASIMSPHYAAVISTEAANLKADANHVLSELDASSWVARIMDQFKAMEPHPWTDLLNSVQWIEAASQTILNHLHSAMHVERLLFADRNPENGVAQSYKSKFQGQP